MGLLNRYFFGCILVLMQAAFQVQGKSEAGIVDFIFRYDNQGYQTQRLLLKDTKIYVEMACHADAAENVTVHWTLIEHECWIIDPANLYANYDDPPTQNRSKDIKTLSKQIRKTCEKEDHAIEVPTSSNLDPKASNTNEKQISPSKNLILITARDGIYQFELYVKPQKPGNITYTATTRIKFYGPHGYISATDWPFLPFYGIMCLVYLVYGFIWLFVSFMQWRDLLRIQFWIGGVILLGMLEKAFFYAQYHSLTTKGVPVEEAELAAEFVSCAKRTLARMLVIIMSLGFGIVKPRLGPMLHRVVGVGTLYFVLACVESYLRVTHTKQDERNELLVASIPLAVLDTGICWWIFTSLVQTTRTLRLRRNMVKLSLYRHFTNTLIFSVIASVIFMLFAIRLRKTENCTPGWKDIWIDTAFWHILFSVLLLVIMILWRPTNNNQRYAFTPLLDNPEDEDDDEEDQFVADAYGVKMRGTPNGGNKANQATSSQRGTTTEDDDLRWVEENIPSSMSDPTLPILDSDEEIVNTKFEVSKMQ